MNSGYVWLLIAGICFIAYFLFSMMARRAAERKEREKR